MAIIKFGKSTRMAGVCFIICVPCERYEQILLNRHWETKTTSNPPPQQIAASSSDEEINYYLNSKVSKRKRRFINVNDNEGIQQESRHSSLETFTISIESDSLNRGDKKDDATDKKKQLPRTKSVDDIGEEKVRK